MLEQKRTQKKQRSGTLSASVDKLKERLGSLKYLARLDNYTERRSARSNMEDISDAENNLNVTQSAGESDKDLSAQNVAVAIFGEYIASKL